MKTEMEESPYISKIWLKSYDTHVKPEIDIDLISLADLFKQSVNEFPDSMCYDFHGARASYKEAEKAIISFANFLLENGVKKGDVVAIQLPNSPQYLTALYGSFYAGCVSTGVNFLLKTNELIYQLSDSGAVAIITLDAFYEQTVRKALLTGETSVKIVITTNISDTMRLNPIVKFLGKKLKKIPFGKIEVIEGIKHFTYKEVIENYPSDKAPEVDIDPEKDLAFLQYTGGTTGLPKGAILTHENLISNIKQIFHWLDVDVHKGEENYLSGFPFFHLAGMAFNLASINNAAGQILIPNPRDVAFIISKMKEYAGKIALLTNVPTLYLMIMNQPKFKELDLSSIKAYISGAAPFASETIKQFENVVGEHKVLEVYGMTEASPIVTMSPYIGTRKIGKVGIPVSNTEVKIVDVTDKSKEVALGEAGEIVVKGPQVFKGYWNKPEETENALKEGWFYTGDVGVMDEDGYIQIVDRTKDMINVSGFKVFSVEVDDKMNKHPAIEIASSVGVPDPDRPGSEMVKLYVQLKQGIQATEDVKADILNFAKENLASYKIPKKIEILEQIPLTLVGKVDKKALRTK